MPEEMTGEATGATTGGTRPTAGPAGAAPRRETVTGVPLTARRRPPGHTPARSEISEQTSLGATYVRALMRSQLRAALSALATLVLLVGSLPLLFALPAGAGGGPASLLVWACIGLAVYPVLWFTARRYVHRAERNERDFTGLITGPRSRTRPPPPPPPPPPARSRAPARS